MSKRIKRIKATEENLTDVKKKSIDSIAALAKALNDRGVLLMFDKKKSDAEMPCYNVMATAGDENNSLIVSDTIDGSTESFEAFFKRVDSILLGSIDPAA